MPRAVESNRIDAGGDRLLAQITGLDEKTIQRGRQELAEELSERPEQRVRLPGGGRPRAEKKTQRETAPWKHSCRKIRQAIPTVGQKWVHSSLRHLSQRLEERGHPVSPPTVGRLLRQ